MKQLLRSSINSLNTFLALRDFLKIQKTIKQVKKQILSLSTSYTLFRLHFDLSVSTRDTRDWFHQQFRTFVQMGFSIQQNPVRSIQQIYILVSLRGPSNTKDIHSCGNALEEFKTTVQGVWKRRFYQVMVDPTSQECTPTQETGRY